ncbi:DUF1592 domain-containing protein [Rubinisphaera sp.]|uniref:DUF1592 domain-containing protein n=1 Tax=Rubinisphaera sp. TaxID=2024857 RepID=UPI000C0D5557|nr:DUF1592 domain-containing protein [Rubinisphaera sp.]MBV11782.1 hypothetical protein [Rubinisphaera sp.]HCS51173.1 hypothetical protein [Planctomycetaceae bacterium]|tara:strand:- start:10146 stop:12653 length:2508 start_codon:yes stop_codon:yes gene_type:complete
MNMHFFEFVRATICRVSWGIAFSVAVSSSIFAAETDPKDNDFVASFLKKHCLDCHNTSTSEGERNFESFVLPIQSLEHLITADEIIDQVTLRKMPPDDAVQPSDEHRVLLVTALRDRIQEARSQFESSGSRTVMRRLSNREYENTLAVLFDRRVDTLGLTADFPKENTSQHMDNIGEALVTSGFLLDQYFEAATRLVETRLGKPEIKTQSWHFTDNFKQYEELSNSHRSVFNYEFLCLYEQPNTDTRQGGYGHIEDFLKGVPVSGLYDIEVNAQAMHRDTHYDPKIFRIDFSEPFQLAVVPGDVTKGHIHYPQAIEPILASAIVPDDQPEWLTFRVWLEAGQTPRFIFPNGPYESRASVIETNKRYKDEFEKPQDGVSRTTLLREGKLPHIKIGEIKVHGPIVEPGGSKEEIAVFGSEGFQEDLAIQQLFAFAKRAYRRPLNESDQQRIEALYEKRLFEQATPRQAALDTLKMILCSPSFLYLSEITPEEESKLHPYDLASRLSYALWTTPPDDELFAAAESGRLTETEELKKQVRRLLSDPRSEEFINGFLDSWLNLRAIGDLPPPRKEAWEYYAQILPDSMKQEARLFFRALLDENGSVADFLDSDYTFVDKKLANLYQLPEKDTLRLEDGFQRVSLTDNKKRGGLLGMAGVLTVSANGVDTSPVTRGVWVLENILGTSPPPPPDEVPAFDADVSGAKTIREKLAIHSSDHTCYVCHRNIDPHGHALESFDPIGRWRDKYAGSKSPKVDPTGKFPSGEKFEDFDSFKKVLLETRLDLFTRSLIEKLLTYSTGRHMERSDQFEIEDILERVKADHYGLQTIVIEVLTSNTFRSR